VALLLVGAAVGLAWAAATPTVRGWSAKPETALAPEVTMAGLGLLVGLVVAVVGLLRPGTRPVVGLIVRLVGSMLGSCLAWWIGRLAGATTLQAPGVLVFWPLTVAVVTAAVTLVVVLLSPEPN
jgi:hypothetical protein